MRTRAKSVSARSHAEPQRQLILHLRQAARGDKHARAVVRARHGRQHASNQLAQQSRVACVFGRDDEHGLV